MLPPIRTAEEKWLLQSYLAENLVLATSCRDFSFLLILARCYHATHSSARLKHQPQVFRSRREIVPSRHGWWEALVNAE